MEGPFVRITTALPSEQCADAPIAFLDRDGVINRGRAGYVNRPSEVELLDGAAEAIGRLKRHGYLVCVVTNQSPISRGLWGPTQLDAIHQHVQTALLALDEDAHIDAFITCPHRYEDGCGCRKPLPAMLALGHRMLRLHPVGPTPLANAGPQHYPVDWWGEPPKAPHVQDAMVGDRRSDLGAGWGFGARLFRVSGHVGLDQVIDRVLDEHDGGDDFQP